MGKAKRNKEQRAEQEMQRDRAREEKNARKKARQSKVIKVIALVLAVILLCIGVVFLINTLRDAGTSLRRQTVAASEHYSVNAAMASYYLYNNYTAFREDGASYIDSLFDSSLSLKKQTYPSTDESGESITWFDYFVNATGEQITNYLVLAEKAHELGMQDDPRIETALDAAIEALKQEAETADQSFGTYLKIHFGRGVRERDVRDALRLYYIANTYYADYVESLTVTADDLAAEESEHRADYETASFYTVDINAVYEVATATDADIEAAVKEAKREADRLAGYHTESAFTEAMAPYLAADETAESRLERDVPFKDSTDALGWVFDQSRKSGDTAVFQGAEKYTVYFVLAPTHKDMTESRSFRHIEFTAEKYGNVDAAKTKAKEVYDLILSTGKDSFEDLADTYSEDMIIYYDSQFAADLEPAIADWLFDPARRSGERTVITTDSSAHILSYEGVGKCGWEKAADAAICQKRCDALLAELAEQYPIEWHEDAYDRIEI